MNPLVSRRRARNSVLIRRSVAVAWIGAALSGCAWKVRVDTRPVAAQVLTASGGRYRVPADVPVSWHPFARPVITVSAPGYRTVQVPLHLGWGPLSIRGERSFEVSLVPVHGPVGTWTPDDVP